MEKTTLKKDASQKFSKHKLEVKKLRVKSLIQVIYVSSQLFPYCEFLNEHKMAPIEHVVSEKNNSSVACRLWSKAFWEKRVMRWLCGAIRRALSWHGWLHVSLHYIIHGIRHGNWDWLNSRDLSRISCRDKHKRLIRAHAPANMTAENSDYTIKMSSIDNSK